MNYPLVKLKHRQIHELPSSEVKAVNFDTNSLSSLFIYLFNFIFGTMAIRIIN